LGITRGEKRQDKKMKKEQTADLAYIAGSLASERKSNRVYDPDQGYVSITGTVEPGRVRVFDHARGAHITGTDKSFYDHSEGSHVSLRVSGKKFQGYDYASGNHFTGHVSGRTVWVYDYETGEYTHYSI
jgi:hypothetical protein